VGEQKNDLHLGFGVPELVPSLASDATAQAMEKVLGMGKVCGLFPWLGNQLKLGIGQETRKAVGHCVGHEH